jgi:hypothetical protein
MGVPTLRAPRSVNPAGSYDHEYRPRGRYQLTTPHTWQGAPCTVRSGFSTATTDNRDHGVDLTAGSRFPLSVPDHDAVAQVEKALIVSTLKAARIRKRKATGKCGGRKPFGNEGGGGGDVGADWSATAQAARLGRAWATIPSPHDSTRCAPRRGPGRPWLGPTV